MPRQKVIDGVYFDLSEAEEAELDAMADAGDLDLSHVRQQRDGLLRESDWTDLPNAPLTAEKVTEWVTYRQELRDYPAQSDRISTLPEWPVDPPAAKIARKVAAGEAAQQVSLDDGGTDEEAQTAYDTAYAATD